MPTLEFKLRLNRVPPEDEAELLYEATDGDAGVEWNPGTGYSAVAVRREAGTLAEALVSAAHDVERVPGLQVVDTGQEGDPTAR